MKASALSNNLDFLLNSDTCDRKCDANHDRTVFADNDIILLGWPFYYTP